MSRSILTGTLLFAVLWRTSAEEPATATPLPRKPTRTLQPLLPYPFKALTKGVEGKVVAEFVILESGKVAEVRIVNDAPPLLADPIKAALMDWNAGPAEPGDPPRPETRTARYEFRLSPRDARAKWPFMVFSETRLKKLKILSTANVFDSPPDWTNISEPAYPADLPKPGSKVTVQFDVSESGRVENVALPDKTPESLATTIRTAFESWRFKPASK